jgi:curved DNA-binding protein CbpA
MLSKHRVLSAREEEVVALREEHKKLMKKIKTARNSVDKLQKEITETRKRTATTMEEKFRVLDELQREVTELFQRCIDSGLFKPRDAATLEDMKQRHKDSFDDDEESPMSEEEFGEFFRQQNEARWQEFFEMQKQKFTAHLSEEDRQSIREVYKRLASKFHPDKAGGDPKLEARFNAIMQRINQAYERADIGELLAIEEEFAKREDILAGSIEPLADLVEAEVKRLEREIHVCTEQLKRLKTERAALSRSDDGMLHAQFKNAVKYGMDPLARITRNEDEAIEELTYQKQMLSDVLTGKVKAKDLMKDIYRSRRAAEREGMITFENLVHLFEMAELQEELARQLRQKTQPQPTKRRTQSRTAGRK